MDPTPVSSGESESRSFATVSRTFNPHADWTQLEIRSLNALRDKFINSHESLSEEFCYMNRNGPYEFQIIPFSRINPNDYMTISARGVTHFCNGDLTFISLEDWEVIVSTIEFVIFSVYL